MEAIPVRDAGATHQFAPYLARDLSIDPVSQVFSDGRHPTVDSRNLGPEPGQAHSLGKLYSRPCQRPLSFAPTSGIKIIAKNSAGQTLLSRG